MRKPRVFKSKWFQRFAKREEIEDSALLEAIDRAGKGLVDADLGGGVIKQRVARPGQGRSKGYRTIILFRRGERAFFVFGFPKSSQDNIQATELEKFREAATNVFSMSEEHLAALLKRGEFVEVNADEQEVPQ